MPSCPSCGGSIEPGDAFCAVCGASLSPRITAPLRLPLARGFLEVDDWGIRLGGGGRGVEIPWQEVEEVGTALRTSGGGLLVRSPTPSRGIEVAVLYVRPKEVERRRPKDLLVAQDEVSLTPEVRRQLQTLYRVPGKDPPYHLLALALVLQEIVKRAAGEGVQVQDRLHLLAMLGSPKT